MILIVTVVAAWISGYCIGRHMTKQELRVLEIAIQQFLALKATIKEITPEYQEGNHATERTCRS